MNKDHKVVPIEDEELLKKEIFFVDYCTSYCFNFVKNNEIKFIGRIEPSFD